MPTYKPQYKDKNGAIKDLNIDYNSLANKPTIGSGTLTIQKNGSNIATFGANSTSNVTANISVPTTLDDINDGSTRKLANYLPLSGGTMTGTTTLPENKMAIKFRTHTSYEGGIVYGTDGNEALTVAMKNPVTAFQIVYGTKPSAFVGNTWQNVTPLFQTKDNKVIINRKITQTSDTTNLKLLDVNGDMAATTIYEGGTALSSKYQAKGSYAAANHNHDSSYLGKTATAANSNKLNNQEASYYAKDSEVVKTSGNQDNIGGDKTFTGTLKTKNLFVAPPDANTSPRIKVYNQVDEYYVNMPSSSGTLATTGDLPTAGTGLNLSNGVFSVKTEYTTNGKNYKVAADASGNLYVNVPWTDTNTNTWRPVVDNLTSTATDQSLSANQGKVLKGLVDGKAASDHTHSQYLTSHLYRPIQVNGSSILANTNSTALNLKAGTNISLSNSNGTVTISSTASGGGMTSSLIFAGAGDTSGYYTQTLSGGDYKMLLFEVNVNDVDFYLSVPTDYIKTGSKTLYLAAGNSNNGSMGIVEITASNTNFSASVSNGNIIIWNVNVYAYK